MSNSSQSKTKLKSFSQDNESKLYIVATPIGNLGDISMRAVEILQSVEMIYCEDTRVSSKLLTKIGVNKKLGVYNDHSTAYVREKILSQLQSGKSIALISDAGTPLISDPGFKLIEYLQKNDVKIVPIPGASSLIAALSASGMPTDTFYFGGFLPNTAGKLDKALEGVKPIKSTLVFFESPSRVLKTLKAIAHVFGNVEVCAARELTKVYEEIVKDDVTGLIKHFESKNEVKGEFVIMINNRIVTELDDEEITAKLKIMLKTMSLKDAVESMAQGFDIPKKRVYALGLRVLNVRGS